MVGSPTPDARFFWVTFSWQFSIYSQGFLFQKSVESKSPKKHWHVWTVALSHSRYSWVLHMRAYFSQDYSLVYQTTYIECVNFNNDCWHLLFKIDLENRFLRKFLRAIFYSLSEISLPEICWEKVAKDSFHFTFLLEMPDLRVWTVFSCLISQHTTY